MTFTNTGPRDSLDKPVPLIPDETGGHDSSSVPETAIDARPSTVHWWTKYEIPWFAWPFVVVAIVAPGVLVLVTGIFAAIVDPTGGWYRIAAVGLVATVVLPFTGNWGWTPVALIVTGVLGIRDLNKHVADSLD